MRENVKRRRPRGTVGEALRVSVGSLLSASFTLACDPRPLPFETEDGESRLVIEHGTFEATQEAEPPAELGTIHDDAPFEPTGERLVSTAVRTWIYTDTGPSRTRLGYLRAGAVVDARGPAILNDGCRGGWYRINPRGFVCIGLGASLDLNHPLVRQAARRPTRGEGAPYTYALSQDPPPYRYFKLPTQKQMLAVEGQKGLDRGASWLARARESKLAERLPLSQEIPDFLLEPLTKPYGVDIGLRTQVHAGQARKDSGFAFLNFVESEGRAFGLTTDMDLLPLDRVKLVQETTFEGVRANAEMPLRAGFLLRGSVSLWSRSDSGQFRPVRDEHGKRGYLLTGQKERELVETSEGLWVARSALKMVPERKSFPSVAVGNRKWIDVSIRDQMLVAYEGRRPVFATLVSTGRGGVGDPDRDQATVQGTFMIYEKSVSSTMDGEEDRTDSFDLRDVPFVQYFHKGFALHGAYWHDEFGRARSHGCVNLAPRDAAFLFEWTDPQVPPDWHAVLNKERGTVVIVRP